MKNRLLFIVFFSLSFLLKAQEEVFFENPWFLYELRIDGQTISIPPNEPTTSCFTGISFEYGNGSSHFYESGLCNSINGEFVFSGNEVFTITSLNQTGGGSCHNSDGRCTTTGALYLFEQPYFGFFQEGMEYQYFFTFIDADDFSLTGLTVYDENGNYADYFSEYIDLSTAGHSAFSFSIYPNPVSGSLFIRNVNNEPVSVLIHTLSGKIVPAVLNHDKIDVSHLVSGMYFLTITDANEQKTVRKFVKK